jgi:hypothetical protein
MLKFFLIITFLTYPIFAESGVKGFVCLHDAGFGGGGGIFGQYPINNDKIKFCPGLDIVQFSHVISGIEKKCTEIDINFDVKGIYKFKIFEPFCGIGYTPIACLAFKRSENDTSSKNPSGVQAFLGFGFPLIGKITGLVEARVKFFSDYNNLKFSTGFLF